MDLVMVSNATAAMEHPTGLLEPERTSDRHASLTSRRRRQPVAPTVEVAFSFAFCCFILTTMHQVGDTPEMKHLLACRCDFERYQVRLVLASVICLARWWPCTRADTAQRVQKILTVVMAPETASDYKRLSLSLYDQLQRDSVNKALSDPSVLPEDCNTLLLARLQDLLRPTPVSLTSLRDWIRVCFLSMQHSTKWLPCRISGGQPCHTAPRGKVRTRQTRNSSPSARAQAQRSVCTVVILASITFLCNVV